MGKLNRNVSFAYLILAATLLVAGGRVTAAEQRIALVIGNSAYPSSPLRNPVNDANAMAEKLGALGFEVMLRTNTTQKDINRAIVQFGQKLTAGSVGLFYYAGHGLQVRGKNFLIPVDAEIETESSVRSESVDVDQVLDQFASSRLSMVILDACRNNPFERRFRSGQGGGLAQIDAPKGALIAYATAPGKTAADGSGSNGVYTEQLLKAMDAPGAKVEDVFKQVRINVARATQDQQIPWEASSLVGEFYFRAPGERPAFAAPAANPAPSVDPAAFEMAFWDSIKSSNNRSDFEAYLEQHPKGRFAPLARSRVKVLEQGPVVADARIATFASGDKERADMSKEMDRMQAELARLKDSNAQLALALPSAIAAPNPSYKAEWAQRIALLEKLRGQLTLSKALSVLLDISSSDDLSLLLTHEKEVNKKSWNNAYAIGTDSNGKLIWGGGYRLRTAADAAQTALDHCKKSAGNLCTVVSVNGDFKETNFRELITRLGVQNIATVRNSFLVSLRKAPTTSTIGNPGAGNCSTESCFSYGYASVSE